MHYWWEYRLVQPLWDTVWSFFKKIKNRTAVGPSDSTAGICPENPKTPIEKEPTHPYVHSSAIFNIHELGTA